LRHFTDCRATCIYVAIMKIAAALLVVATLAGCSSTHRMDIYDLRYMKIDCANKEAQIKFLETQMSTEWDRLSATYHTRGMLSGLMGAINGTYTQQKALADREYDKIAKNLIWDLRTQCP